MRAYVSVSGLVHMLVLSLHLVLSLLFRVWARPNACVHMLVLSLHVHLSTNLSCFLDRVRVRVRVRACMWSTEQVEKEREGSNDPLKFEDI